MAIFEGERAFIPLAGPVADAMEDVWQDAVEQWLELLHRGGRVHLDPDHSLLDRRQETPREGIAPTVEAKEQGVVGDRADHQDREHVHGPSLDLRSVCRRAKMSASSARCQGVNDVVEKPLTDVHPRGPLREPRS